MLVVPQLVWSILFGQNHLDIIGAETNHTKCNITFTDPDLNFTFACPNCIPKIELYPWLGPPKFIAPSRGPYSAHVATPLCLLTSSPTPSQPNEPIRLHRGFNFVTLCLVMTASLVGFSMVSAPLWLEGNEVCPGVHVITGPITQSCFSSQPIIPEPPPAMHHNYPKCRPSRMLSEPEPPLQPDGLLASQIPASLSDFELPNFSTVFTTTILAVDHTVHMWQAPCACSPLHPPHPNQMSLSGFIEDLIS